MDEHIKALDKAKIGLMSKKDSTFFTTICFSLKHVWDETISTAATDGRFVYYNPAFFLSLSPDERIFLLLHEALHVAFLHMFRRGNRDKKRWNIAADHVINLLLIERGFVMPKGGYADPQYRGLSVEEVYDRLPNTSQEEIDIDIMDPADGASEDLQRQVEDILVRAQLQSQMANDAPGSIPAEFEIFLNKLLNPKLPWNRILLRYMQSTAKSDYSFRKPNRRYQDPFMPSLHSEGLIDFAVAVDTSGSVTDDEFLRFISETVGILKIMKPEKVTVIQFDTQLKSVEEVRNLRELKNIQFTGRGGTRIDPVLNWANENKPKLMLVFTDGFFRFTGNKTKTNTIWLIHNNPTFSSPFGKVIHYEV